MSTQAGTASRTDWQRHADVILRRFDQLDKLLVSRGFPPTSPWWRRFIERWYRSGKKRAVIRAGRRAGKSSTLCRLGVVEALYGEHAIPPGDIGWVAVVSMRRADALERLRTIAAILDALGVNYTPKGDTIELPGRRTGFAVYTASIGGVSGFTAIFLFLDEVAKWKDSDTGVNPANEVIKSIGPTMLTQKNAKMVLSSSPMGYHDAHADEYGKGENALQIIAHAASWEANPTVTEEDTRALEANEVIWLREYKAIPQAEDELSLLSEASLRPCMRGDMFIPRDDRHHYVATMDPATRGNAWTFAITTLSDQRIRRVVFTHEWVGSKNAPLKSGTVFKEMKPMLEAYGLRHVHSDQWSEDTLRELAQPHGVYLVVDPPWTVGTKADAYDGLRTIVRDKLFEFAGTQVLDDLLGIREKLTRNGILYELADKGSRHSDFAPTLAMGVMLATTPPKPKPEKLSPGDWHAKLKQAFLEQREKDRKKRDKQRGRIPATHRR